jgi:hypothetical protein
MPDSDRSAHAFATFLSDFRSALLRCGMKNRQMQIFCTNIGQIRRTMTRRLRVHRQSRCCDALGIVFSGMQGPSGRV